MQNWLSVKMIVVTSTLWGNFWCLVFFMSSWSLWALYTLRIETGWNTLFLQTFVIFFFFVPENLTKVFLSPFVALKHDVAFLAEIRDMSLLHLTREMMSSTSSVCTHQYTKILCKVNIWESHWGSLEESSNSLEWLKNLVKVSWASL